MVVEKKLQCQTVILHCLETRPKAMYLLAIAFWWVKRQVTVCEPSWPRPKEQAAVVRGKDRLSDKAVKAKENAAAIATAVVCTCTSPSSKRRELIELGRPIYRLRFT